MLLYGSSSFLEDAFVVIIIVVRLLTFFLVIDVIIHLLNLFLPFPHLHILLHRGLLIVFLASQVCHVPV